MATYPRNRFRNGPPPEGRSPLPDRAQVTAAPAAGTAKDHHFVDFCRSIRKAGSSKPWEAAEGVRRLRDEYGSLYESSALASPVHKAAMGESSGTVGGYLVPPEFSWRLLEPLAEDTFLYPRARVVPMGSGVAYAPVWDALTVPAAVAQSPFFGGITFKWGKEQAPLETEPTARQVQFTPWDLLGYADVSNQWLADVGPEGEDYLIKLFGAAGAWYAEYAFLRGLGAPATMPIGVISGNGFKTSTRSGHNLIAAADVAGMAAVLLPRSWKTAVWACNPGCLAQLVAMTGFTLNRPESDDYRGAFGALLGRPVFVTEKLPALGTSGDFILFDPDLYAIGDRGQVLIDVSEHLRFATFQTEFRIWLRLDGMPMLSGTVTLQDKATVVSAYVGLTAP